MGKVIIHIGSPKTGTTSIQRFMSENAKTLTKFGILYPDVGHDESCGHTSFRKALLSKPTQAIVNNKHEYSAIFEQLEDDVSCLLSTELLWTINPERLLSVFPFLANHEVIVVCYLRNQISMIHSHIKQKIKSGRDIGSLSVFFAANYQHYDYYEKLSRWESVFGKGSVQAYAYELESSVSIVDSFLKKVVVKNRSASSEVSHDDGLNAFTSSEGMSMMDYRNKSLSEEIVALIQAINSSGYSEEAKFKLRSLLISCGDNFNEIPGFKSEIFDEETQSLISKYYKSSNEALLNSFFSCGYAKKDLISAGWVFN
ncbi:hypothetical protein ACJJIF_06745 [Microbulbifer sp. SSSA002]|uniref:hypothetical protein n=1 Tax=unclassified Microbulbifer TaxID=2619833 RepID=UPI004039C027